ncbi:MAG: nitrous oxide reductase accessory protein NosL [Nitrospirae bacterium]|uniref:nitrous oxide reductase accessory protein NosL n=1 Tax=Candidatus Magnetobacterium casense TaxID=1455061 RepID=UPI00058E1188|nr:nitrous oxide reductase accessory protein NosL [Candidatus Magnetobacterium casensis]MBF0338900.1 nitrous oxide reductase accessory protein NosL [Nitrospirota bacterium]
MRKLSRLVSLVLLVFLLSAVASHAAEALKPNTKDKCPVCGMVVHPHPQWVAQMIFKDGSYAMFDGPKDMFKYYHNMAKYNKDKTQADISDIYVTEYYSTKPVKAQDITFVTGSDVMGPMGKEYVPVSDDKVKNFMVDHKGAAAVKFADIKPEDLVGDMPHKHKGH